MQESVNSSGTPSSTPSLITSLFSNDRNGVTIVDRVVEAERQRARHGGKEFRRGVRKRVSGERTEGNPFDAVLRAVDSRLAQEHDVAPGEVHLFVGRVECRRGATQRPVRCRVYVFNREGQPCERRDVDVKRRSGQQLIQCRQLGALPREAGTDVERMHRAFARCGGGKHRTVETGR